MSRNFKFYYFYLIGVIGFILYVNNGLTNAQPNITATNTLSPNAQPNTAIPNAQPNTTTARPNTTTPNAQPSAASTSTSSSITETVNEVLSGSINGMIGETVNMLRDTAKTGKDSAKASVEKELPSSLALEKNNNTVKYSTPKEKIEGNVSKNNLNIDRQNRSINESNSDSVNQIKQSAQKSIYNSTIVQSFDNNSLTKLENQNTLDELVYKMKNILDIDLFK